MLDALISDDRLTDDEDDLRQDANGNEQEEISGQGADIDGVPSSKHFSGVWRTYLWGQFAHLNRTALWWSGLSPLALAVVGRDTAVGATRVSFNLALLIFSPLAGAVAERTSMKKILLLSTTFRLVLYAVLLPLCWLLLRSTWVFESLDSSQGMFAALVIITFLDGMQLAFGNVVDVDMGGVDILGGQLEMPVHDSLRNKMNALYSVALDGSFIFFTPAIALAVYYIGQAAIDDGSTQEEEDRTKAGVLVGAFAIVFLVSSLISLRCYAQLEKPRKVAPASEYEPIGQQDSASNNHQVGNQAELASEQLNQSACQEEETSIIGDIWQGAKLCWNTTAIRWRLFFFGLEVALEDAVVAVVISEYAYTSRLFGDGDATKTNLYVALIVAVGKLGAVAAGSFMHSCWKTPTSRAEFRPVFLSVLAADACIVLLWLAHSIEGANDNEKSPSAWISRCLVFAGVVCFFFFATAPKIAFATLLQTMASTLSGSGKIFGFVGPAISIIDSIVVMSISVTFGAFKAKCQQGDDDYKECLSDQFNLALGITAAIFVTHGIFEAFLGPRLMLPHDPAMLAAIGITE